jgi:hypothetical protein
MRQSLTTQVSGEVATSNDSNGHMHTTVKLGFLRAIRVKS